MSTLAQQFATDYAKGVVPAALDALKLVKRNTKRIAMLALAVSTPHQALYLFGLGHPHGALDVIAAVFFAVLIPLTIDLGIITSLAVTQTVGIAKRAKRRALIVLALLVAASATVNVLAEGPIVVRALTAFTAVVLALVEWMAAAIAPDFTELEQAEASAAPAVAVVDEAAAERRRAAARKGAATKAAKAAKAKAERDAANERRRLGRMEREMREAFDTTVAPVSPAPAGKAHGYL